MRRDATGLATRPRTLRWLQVLACLVLGFCAARPAASQERVVIYRCTDATGAVTLQNGTPCPKGSQQQRRVMDTATSVGVPTPGLPAPAPPVPPDEAAPVAAPPAAPVERPLPPALYACRTFDGRHYLGDRADPPPRCVPLGTTGLDGSPGIAAAACEMKQDECQRLPDEVLCDRWRERRREADAKWRAEAGADRAQADAERQRLTRIVEESRCGAEPTR